MQTREPAKAEEIFERGEWESPLPARAGRLPLTTHGEAVLVESLLREGKSWAQICETTGFSEEHARLRRFQFWAAASGYGENLRGKTKKRRPA